ncbi:SDR family oxidoreductase [Rhodospirillaceae bacterium KN72]|uniref:SDR family oxidoreductase n=1 Tax=Pacificispira spongiicola TaxID=2729598 RepID=A0A7Y0HH50_9PROT|nr:SDR family oxidoreductase [Pacificispira spongiicola]NMM45592.1 SDR family oxidoreductase [Pacificispira spongiicola]
MTFSYKDQFDLTGKVAVVTGACGTLGPGMCEGLAEQGAHVVLSDIKAKAATELAAALTDRFGVQCIGVECDVADEASVEAMTREAVSAFGHVDILLNNAANATPDLEAYFAPFEAYSLDEWRRNLTVDLDGMFLVAKHVGAEIAKTGRGGSIIQTASIYAAYGSDNRIYEGAEYKGTAINNPAVYSSGKAGVLGLTRWLATHWAKDGVRVNALVPGGVQSGQNEEFVRRYANRVPMARMGRKEEVVGPMLWLASDASSYVTGQFIFVDGGLSAW